jgi:endonuclease YncB( thermonuclease family)
MHMSAALSFSARPDLVARAISVHDGDTLTARAEGRDIKIRLWGIDAPELAQPYGTSATLELRRLVEATTFSLTVKSTDRYGRRVAIITLPDHRQVNSTLVSRGAAWHYQAYAPKALDLLRAQEQARADLRGLWREPHPTAPSTFRAAKRPTPRKR